MGGRLGDAQLRAEAQHAVQADFIRVGQINILPTISGPIVALADAGE